MESNSTTSNQLYKTTLPITIEQSLFINIQGTQYQDIAQANDAIGTTNTYCQWVTGRTMGQLFKIFLIGT